MARDTSLRPSDIWQRIVGSKQEDLTYDPADLPESYVSRLWSRVLAHLVAYTASRGEPIRLACTDAGRLHVSSFPEEFVAAEDWDYSTDTTIVSQTWVDLVAYTELWITGEDCEIRITMADGTQYGWFRIRKGFYEFRITYATLEIRSISATLTVGTVIAWR